MKKLKNYYSLIISPLLVSLILLSVFFIYKMYPFGTGSVSWCDMNQQVVPLLMDFKDILTGKDGILFSMQNAGGMSFWGVFCFFLSGPLSLLSIFVSKSEMIYFVNILIILKLSLCALTAALYFKKCKPKLHNGISIALSLMYALCGYGMLFYQNIMWLDIMYLFPILMIGLEKLTKQKNNLLYIISLTAIMVMNFYICYMVAVFILIYMALYYFSSKGSQARREVCAKFLSGTLISALISSIVWLPSIIQVSASGRVGSVFDNINGSKFLSGYYTVLPMLFCTALIFVILLFHFFSRNQITKKQRSNLILLTLMLIPLFIEPVNILWHTGNYMSFPARYGFITVFIGLICCSDFLEEKDEKLKIKNSKLQYLIIPITAALLYGYYYFTARFINNNFEALTQYTATLWGTKESFDGLAKLFIISACCYLIILILYRKKFITKSILAMMLVMMCALEAMGNIRLYMISPAINNPSRTATFSDITDLSDRINDDDFYRVATDYKTSDYNLVGALGYNSISHYTSLTDHNYMKMQKLLGYSTVWMKTAGNGGTELTDALYSIKYRLTEKKNSNKNIVVSNDKFAIDTLPYYMGLGLICDNDLSECKDFPDNMTRAQIQQYVFQNIFNTKQQLISEYNYDKNESKGISYSDNKYQINNSAKIKYKCFVSGKQSLYFDCYDNFSNSLSENYYDGLTVKVDGSLKKSKYPNADGNGLLKLGEFENQTVTIEITSNKNLSCYSFGVFGLDLNLLSDSIEKSQAMDLKYSGGKIYGKAYAGKNKTCLLAVPYNEGLKIKVNGKYVECRRVISDFTAFELNEGENIIEITLIPKGFITGLIITLIGIALFVLYIIFGKKLRLNNKLYAVIEAATGFVTICAALMIYIFPVMLSIIA